MAMTPGPGFFTRGMASLFGMARRGPQVVFSKEHNRAQLCDVERRISIYLRALWCRDFIMKPILTDPVVRATYVPFVEQECIHLPDAFHDLALGGIIRIAGLDSYRAAATHAAAHIMYGKAPWPAKAFDKWQAAMISVIEDARVETLAIRRFPGLQQLWSLQHTVTPAQGRTAGDFLNRLARALLDEHYQDEDPWIVQGRTLFNAAGDLEDSDISRVIGMTLAHAFQGKRIAYRPRTDLLTVPYRDDNRHMWKIEHHAVVAQEKPVATWKFKMALLDSDEVVQADEAGEISAEPFTRTIEIRESISGPYSYPEWDFHSQTETQSWVTLREIQPESGDLQVVDRIITRNSQLIARMKTLLNSIRDGGVRRIRKLEEGDEIDVNAAIRAQIDLRMGRQPDTRIMMRTKRKNRDISVLVLLDLSASMNEMISGKEQSAMQMTQEVCVLFADAIQTVGDPFAIHGFCSETRHNVEYYRFKDFDQPYDDVPKARIAGITGMRATRMGAAIRHATHLLNQEKSGRKLLLLITDGAPSDVDVDVNGRDYLLYDTKMAVELAGRSGINTYCIDFDPNADDYVSRIFGARNYIVVDQLKHLPEKLLLLYTNLTRKD
jgi:nitric oxide reductase NorD protein